MAYKSERYYLVRVHHKGGLLAPSEDMVKAHNRTEASQKVHDRATSNWPILGVKRVEVLRPARASEEKRFKGRLE